MFFPRTLIELNVADAAQSAAFYAALFGTPPTRVDSGLAVFELDSPPVALTLTCARPRPHARFALVVTQPEHVGRAAVALRRARVQIRLEDEGIVTEDPDGNGWRVRFVPFARGPAVLTVS